MRHFLEEAKSISDARYGVRYERNLLVPLGDGVTVAADLYLPAAEGTWPALVSYYPYHKDDLIGGYVEFPRRYFAERGYASLLVDFRGTGGSEGICTDTFDAKSEGKDGAEVVEWAARQAWCDGGVGVWGISYGGVTSLGIAAQRPPHLKAIAPVYGCPDIYLDFIAPGGCPNCLGNYARESFMLAMDLAPPTFQDAEGRWLRVWAEHLERLAGGDLHSLKWQVHGDYDAHWCDRSIPVEDIEVPAYVIGGWRDIFPQAMPSTYERLCSPKKLLMGPWVHTPPDWSPYEPIDWLYEMRRWWDHWLKGEQNGVMDEPAATIFVQGAESWKHEREWPIARTEMWSLFASSGGALTSDRPTSEGRDFYKADQTVGVRAGLWDPLGTGIGYPIEQSDDDLRSLTYTSEPLEADTEITGAPEAILHVALDQGGEVQFVAKLSAIAPDGFSTLFSTGWLNGRHRLGHDRPQPLERGVTYELRIPMWATSYLVRAGHRLRLAISCSDFPRMWPTRTNPEICVSLGGKAATMVVVPVVPPPPTPVAGPPIRRPEPAVNRTPWLESAQPEWRIERDMVSGATSVTLGSAVSLNLPTGGHLAFCHRNTASSSPERPDAAKVEATANMRIRMPAGERVEVETVSRFTRETMLLHGRITIDGRVFFEHRWSNF